jgi:hypothetical protein
VGTIPASENEFPQVLLAEVAAPSTPASGLVVVYAKSDGKVYSKDDAGTETELAAASAALAAHLADTADAHDASAISILDTGGSFTATDVEAALAELFTAIGAGGIPVTTVDAKGDLIAGTAADTVARVAAGANGSAVVYDSAQSAGIKAQMLPGWLGRFAGITDTTNFFWDGDDKASFTEVDVTGSTTWTESGNGLISCLVSGMTSGDINTLLIAKTISTGDSWYVPIMGVLGHNISGVLQAGVVFTDGTSSTSNAVAAIPQFGLAASGTGDPTSLLAGRHGTLTALTNAPWVLDGNLPTMPWMLGIWCRLTYVSANTFRAEFSPDGISWTAFGEADISKTMTPTHVGILVGHFDADAAIITHGPLRKT